MYRITAESLQSMVNFTAGGQISVTFHFSFLYYLQYYTANISQRYVISPWTFTYESFSAALSTRRWSRHVNQACRSANNRVARSIRRARVAWRPARLGAQHLAAIFTPFASRGTRRRVRRIIIFPVRNARSGARRGRVIPGGWRCTKVRLPRPSEPSRSSRARITLAIGATRPRPLLENARM